MDYSQDEIFTPGTLAVARRQFQNEIVAKFEQRMREEQKAVAELKLKLEADRERVAQQEAANWQATTFLNTQQQELEQQLAVIKRDKGSLAKRAQELELQADQRRLNRTKSEEYLEDLFATSSPTTVVENLTHASARIRKHAMDNIASVISGDKRLSPNFVKFTPPDIAPYILPKLHQLVSSTIKPVESVLRFAEETVSAVPMARALALGGQCQKLADYLVEMNELTSQLAVRSLRQMVRMELSVVQPAYEAMALAIPKIPIPAPHEQEVHPSIDFVKEVAPRIIEDCFNNGLWSAIAPLVGHRIMSIRQIVLHKVVYLARNDRNQDGIVEAHILGFLDSYYQSSSPPPDVITFFVELLPLVADKLFRRRKAIEWLLNRLNDQNSEITATVINVFNMCVTKEDPVVFQTFVKTDLLKKLDDCPMQSPEIVKLIIRLLSALAIPYVRAKAVKGIVHFLDHPDSNVVTACLSACKKIVESTVEDRTRLFAQVTRLSISKKSTLDVYAFAMPAFCRDWAASGDFNTIAKYIQHSESQIRHPAQQVWRDIVRNSPSSRSKIVHDHLLDVIFELCTSPYPDAVALGADCCTPMAIEITKAGVHPTQKLVGFLGVKSEHLRQAALRGIQIASENSDGNCQVLLKAGVFKELQSHLEEYSDDSLENASKIGPQIDSKLGSEIASKILIRLVPFLRTSTEACDGLLQLLGYAHVIICRLDSTDQYLARSKSQYAQGVAHNALSAISIADVRNRETLRAVILDRLKLPSDSLVEYAVKAIGDWIGPDLVLLNDFPKFFSLVEHDKRAIQTAAMITLKQNLMNADYHESLEKANIISLLRSLSNSDNSEALDFVARALEVLALSLARNGHASDIINLVAHKESNVHNSAATALKTIGSGPVPERKHLVEKDVIRDLVARGDRCEQTQLDLLTSIIPMLACDYLEAGKIDLIFMLVDHKQEQIRTAASNSIALLASGPIEQRSSLRKALLPKLEQSPLLREVAANCLSHSLADDLVSDGDFTQIFKILHSEDVRVRKPIIVQLRTHIQTSDEMTRGRLVHAKVLSATVRAYTREKDDVLEFISNCLLPLLGPSFTRDDGGATLFPLLEHAEPRLRISAIQALKNAMDSRYGNMENMAKASIVRILHPLTTNDDIRDLWCRILPKAAPYLENRAEIDILFDSLKNDRGNVREAASEAISVLAKTSEVSRGFMLPTLLHSLESQSPASIPSILQAVSLSGFTFVSHEKEAELLYLVVNGGDVGVAAVEATIQVLAKGGSFEHERLVNANPDILSCALRLHNDHSQRQQSLKLLRSIVMHLSYILFLHEKSARALFSLFDDPDPVLSTELYQTWSSDTRVFKSDLLPGLIPLLFNDKRLRNPSVTALLREWAPIVVPKLVERRRLNILVDLLRINDENIVRSYLEETHYVIQNCDENQKGWFVTEPSFVPVIGEYLKGHDAAMRRNCSSIIQLLSTGSASRSAWIMNEGIGKSLSWVALKGERGAQESSLEALCTLFMAAPDNAGRLVADVLPSLCDILREEDVALGVHLKAFRLLLSIIQHSPHSPVIDSGIVAHVVRWLSPRYTVTDTDCKKSGLDICLIIAEHSDKGRDALIKARILQELIHLTSSQAAYEVIGSCKILKALVHTGTYKQHIIDAGLQKSMEHITSPIRKSTLKIKADKQAVQALAKDILETLKLSKQRDVQPHLQAELLSNNQTRRPETSFTSHRTGPANDEDAIVSRERPHQNRRLNSMFESRGFDRPALNPEMEEVRESATMNARHSRSLSDPARPIAPQARRADLPPVRENPNTSNFQQDTPFEEDWEEMEPNSPPSSQPMANSTPNYPLNRTATPRYQRSSDDNHFMDPSSPIALNHPRTRDWEEREPNSPPSRQPMVHSTTPNSPLNRTATSTRYQQSSDDDYFMDSSSPVALNNSRTRDWEEREPNLPASSQPMANSTPNYPLNRAATSRYQRSSDDNYFVDPSSPVTLTHSRTSPVSYKPSAPARLGSTRRRRVQDDDAPESSAHDSELVSNTAERGAASSQGSAQRSFFSPSRFGSMRR